MRALKNELSTTWVAFIDSDEYIVPNWVASPTFLIQNYTPQMTVYRYPRDGKPYLPIKCLLDVSRVNALEIREHNHNVNRPLRSACDEDDM
jgi:hypothetical protein